MRGDWEILKLLLDMDVSLHNAQDDSKRLPLEYFDFQRANLETLKAYHTISKAWCTRWRSLVKKGEEYMPTLDTYYIDPYLFFADITVLCGAISEGDYDYCNE